MFFKRIERTDISQWFKIGGALGLITLFIFLVVWIATPSLKSYEDSEVGLSFTYPKTWKAEFHERNGSYVITPKKRLFQKGSADITIQPRAVSNVPVARSAEEGLMIEVNRLNLFFKLDDIDFVQPFKIIEDAESEMAVVTISVPTTAIAEDSSRNQMGQREPGVFQIIDLYIIPNTPEYYAVIEVYKGENAKINAQADAIVRSVSFNRKQ